MSKEHVPPLFIKGLSPEERQELWIMAAREQKSVAWMVRKLIKDAIERQRVEQVVQ